MGVKGDSYTGEWKFGKPDGHGIHRWVNGNNHLLEKVYLFDVNF